MRYAQEIRQGTRKAIVVMLMILATVLTGCDAGRDRGPLPGKSDNLLIGLAASANKSVFEKDFKGGFTTFEHLNLEATLAELDSKLDIHRLNAEEADLAQHQYRQYYARFAPGTWPDNLAFKAATILKQGSGGGYVIFFMAAPNKPGFFMVRIQAAPIDYLPPVFSRDPHDEERRKQDAGDLQADVAAYARSKGLTQVSSVQILGRINSAQSGSNGPFGEYAYAIASERECALSNPAAQDLGKIFLAVYQARQQVRKFHAITALPIPAQQIPCYVDRGGAKPITSQVLDFHDIFFNEHGALFQVGLNHGSAHGKKYWPEGAASYQIRFRYLVWCAAYKNCQVLETFVAPSQSDGDSRYPEPESVVLGLNADGKEVLQRWVIDWESVNANMDLNRKKAATKRCEQSVKVLRSWRLDDGTPKLENVPARPAIVASPGHFHDKQGTLRTHPPGPATLQMPRGVAGAMFAVSECPVE
jgi:hypothetical protein